MKLNVTIIGAGLVGSLLSIYMAKRGYTVNVYERRGDMRTQTVEAGRSINLALSDRGIKALKDVGIAEEILRIAIPMHGRQIHNLDGSQAFQPYGKEGQYINSVSRSQLNGELLNLAEQHGVRFQFNHKLQRLDFEKNIASFENEAQAVTTSFELLLGTDGAYSAARLSHMLQHQQFEYSQHYIDCAYKELSIPTGANGRFLIEKNALHIWPRKEFMLIALPNLDGSFTGTLFFPTQGDASFDALQTDEQIDAFFRQHFADIVTLVPDFIQQFKSHPSSSLVTVKCFPWLREDKFCLIGDAAHAIVPFFGQGMNAGFEDCTVLNELMEQHGDDWTTILQSFQELRKPDADAIADLAVTNFAEMRSRTADPKFLLQKKIEARLHEAYPDQWVPAYSQVTFSPHIRYSHALRNSQRQEAIMQEIMQQPGIENDWDKPEIITGILERLANTPSTT